MKKALSFYFSFLFVITIAALVLTTAAMFQTTNFFSGFLTWLIFLDFVLIGVMIITVIAIATRLFLAWRREDRGARLSLRLTLLFLGMSLLPMAIVYTVSTVGIFRSIESWFDTPLHRAFEEGIEFGQDVTGQEFSRLEYVARDIADIMAKRRGNLFFLLDDVRRLQQLNAIVLYDKNGMEIFASNNADGSEKIHLSHSIIQQLNESGRYYNLIGDGGERDIEVILAMPNSPHAYALQLTRALPVNIAEGLTAIEQGQAEYKKLLILRNGLNLSLMLILTLTLVSILLFVTWLSLWLGRRLTAPLVRLTLAAEAVGGGDFTRRVSEKTSIGELAKLNRSFNEMVEDLRQSRNQIQLRQQQLHEANAYMENLLSSLTTGVLTFANDGTLSSYNAVAETLSQQQMAQYVGCNQDTLATLPFFESVIIAIKKHPTTKEDISEKQIRIDNRVLVLRVSLLSAAAGGGVLVIVNDITRQVRAEREATWEEASQRFVHEIKNPLTPVQLAAERLEHKLASKLSSEDATLLNRLVTTIVNQVGAMRQMVDAFRGYADDQRHHFEPVDINTLLGEILLLYESRQLRFQTDLTEDLPPVNGDIVSLRQVLHNLVGNACDAVAEIDEPIINIKIFPAGGYARLVIEDNGYGIKEEMLAKVCEPYITTKPQGTGLGLAVVRRTVDRHNGKLSLENGEEGLRVVVDLPLVDGKNN